MEKFELSNEVTIADFRYAFSQKYEFLYFRVAKNRFGGNKKLSSFEGFTSGALLSFDGNQTVEQFEKTAKALIGADVELYIEVKKNIKSSYFLCSKEYPGKTLDELEKIGKEIGAVSQVEYMKKQVGIISETNLTYGVDCVDNIEISWEKATDFVKNINFQVYEKISDFLDSKDKGGVKFLLSSDNEECYILSTSYINGEITKYYMEIAASGCEIHFIYGEKGIYVEILNDFEDFNDYFNAHKEYGSVIARLLWLEYIETFEEERDADVIIEDEYMDFQNSFVNYILNDVFLE